MRVYLDTCILLDFLLDRNDASIRFIEHFAREKGMTLVLSKWTLIETLGGMKDRFMLLKLIFDEGLAPEEILRKRRDIEPPRPELKGLLDEVRRFVEYDVKGVAEIFDESLVTWDTVLESLETLKKTALDAGDALHLHNALKAKCDIFLTRDSPVTRRVKQSGLIKVQTPEDLMKERNLLTLRDTTLEDMPKPIKEYTDKELEKAIKVHEIEIRKDKETKCSDEESKKELAKGTKMKQEHLQKLYSERDERRKKSK